MTWRFRKIWLLLGWLGVITLIGVCLIRLPDAVDLGSGRDKVVHLAGYFCLMGWFGQLYARRSTQLLFGVGFATLGIAIEFAQSTTTWRGADLMDAGANTAGVILALLLLLTPFQRWLNWFDRSLDGVLQRS